MKFKNVYMENIENYNYKSKMLEVLGEELSVIIWVAIVFVLIICSYMTNKYNLLKESEINT